eukprot:2364315-Amphidinium_carterae.2
MRSTDPIPKSQLGLTDVHLRRWRNLKRFHDEAQNSINAAFMPDVAMRAGDDPLHSVAEVGDVEVDDAGHADPMEAEIPVTPAASPLRLKKEMPASDDVHIQVFDVIEIDPDGADGD